MWCPICKAEYRDGIAICAECGVPLVDALPIEVDASTAENSVRMLNRIDGRENLKALSNGNKAYVQMHTKYEDMKSTAYSFILVGAAGIILMLLIFAGIVPLQFAAYMKGIMGVVMGGMFLLFLLIGVRSYLQLGGLKIQVQKELAQTEAAKSWFFDHYSAPDIDHKAAVRGDEPLQQKYFQRTSFLLQTLKEQFPDYEEAFLDYLAEQFYEELFPQD